MKPNNRTWVIPCSLLALALFALPVFAGTHSAESNIITVDTRGGIALSPVILTQPQSPKPVLSGANVTFEVVVSGTPPFSYQWRFNEQNISGATSATFTLNSVTVANSGRYSVLVWNAYDFVTSKTAALSVLADPANGNRPIQVASPDCPPPPAGIVDSLVIVTHGWQRSWETPDIKWVTDLADAIRLKAGNNWEVVPLNWVGTKYGDGAWQLLPDWALEKAKARGALLGQCLAQQGWKRIHLIAHSAGSALIDAVAGEIKRTPGSATLVQTTFLDPYTGEHLDGRKTYGQSSAWSDNYFAVDFLADYAPVALDAFSFYGYRFSYYPEGTAGPLQWAYNVDVTGTAQAAYQLPVIYSGGVGGATPAIVIAPSHGTPVDFYLSTVNGTVPPCGAGFGFPLSMEANGSGNWATHSANNPPMPLCSTMSLPQNPKPVQLDTTLKISLLPNASSGVTFLDVKGANMSCVSSSLITPLARPSGIRPNDSIDSRTDIPAWLAVSLTITNAVNFIQFDAGFTDGNLAEGLLTVFLNTNQIGMADERVASTNLQTYRFSLPGTLTNSECVLGFRLDAFNNTSSTITVTNVTTGFVGVDQPITLGASLNTNGTPTLQLTGTSGYNYLVQSSTNMIDWEPAALLVNTNGTVIFADPAATNASQRFYRALMP